MKNKKDRIYCVTANYNKKRVIIISIFFNSLTSCEIDTPNENNWTLKQKLKLFKPENKCNKIIYKLKDSLFIKLLSDIKINKIKLNDQNKIEIE